jgi:hypothetical protein
MEFCKPAHSNGDNSRQFWRSIASVLQHMKNGGGALKQVGPDLCDNNCRMADLDSALHPAGGRDVQSLDGRGVAGETSAWESHLTEAEELPAFTRAIRDDVMMNC